GPFPPLVRPASRTRPASRSVTSAWETVGFDNAVSRAICARETGPTRRTLSRTVRSLIARRRLGVPPTDVRSTVVFGPSPSAKETFLTIPRDATLRPSPESRQAPDDPIVDARHHADEERSHVSGSANR